MAESSRHRNLLICLGLMTVVLVVYWPVGHFEFITYDDPVYITENRQLQNGLTLRGLGWALTTPLDQWMPVTWMARILEYHLFDADAGAHHLVNVLFHVINTLLLFGVLGRMTGAPWRSGLVAALFALHPLHVEAVAWVTGLKDVLSTCFWMLTIWAYVRYADKLSALSFQLSAQESSKQQSPRSRITDHQSPTKALRLSANAIRSTVPGFQSPIRNWRSAIRSYALTLFLFALGLMSKPMLVTLPFVLLLLDYWPLGRTRWAEAAAGERVEAAPSQLLKEKLPFFALAAASCVVTYWAQRSVGAVVSIEAAPLGTRVGNALLTYVDYLRKTFWPTGLTVFYPGRLGLPAAAVVGAGIGLAGVTALAVWKARRAPWFVTGWLWYLGTLVPVVGLIQVGVVQGMADRYTYIPLVGLFLSLCWSVPCRALDRRFMKVAVCVVAGIVLAACAVLARLQVGYWKNPETLFRYALKVTRNNWVAHNSLGVALERAGRVEDAVTHYEQALRIRPDYADAHYNLGVALEQTGKPAEAIGQYERALRIKSGDEETRYHLGIALEQVGRLDEALGQYEQAVRINPDFVDAQYCLGLAWLRRGELSQAAEHFEQALRINPGLAEAHHNLGVALEQSGQLGKAISQYEQALRIKPDLAAAHNNLAVVLARMGKLPGAVDQFEQALRIRPDDAETHYNLAYVLEQAGKRQEAIGHYEQALRLNPGMAEAEEKLTRLRSVQ
jgi:tetratricopeptide (TPR) repeat protein